MITEPQLTVTVASVSDTIRIGFTGELDVAVEQQVFDAIAAAITTSSSAETRAVHVDATAVTFIDSSGLRSLVRSSTHTTGHGLTFTLTTAPDGPIPRLLDIAGLTTWFDDHSAAEQNTSP